MSLRGVKFQFRSGESVLCFEPDASKAKVLYDAKILDVSVTHDKCGKRRPAYLIHFLRWNSSWDRVVPESYLLKNSDDNRALMRKLAVVSQKIKRNKTRMKKIDSVLKHHFDKLADPNRPVDMLESDVDDDANTREDEEEMSESSGSVTDSETDAEEVEKDDKSDKSTSDDDEDDGESTDQETEEEMKRREPIKLELPHLLKQILQRDNHLVLGRNNLLKLPAAFNVVSILEGYVKFCTVNAANVFADKQVRATRSQDDNIVTISENNIQQCKEVVDGVRVIFDFILPLSLLYDRERDQYNSLLHFNIRQQQCSSPDKLRACVSPRISVDCQYVDIKTEEETEISCTKKKSSSPRQRRKPKPLETVGTGYPHNCSSERLRRSSRDLPRHSDKDNVAESLIASPISKFTFGSPMSSRASSPERPPPKLTCMEEKHIASTCEVFNWSLIPNELYFQVPAPPSLIYGAQHLLRLFVRLPSILDQMFIPLRKLSHLIRHLELFIQYLHEHRDELFSESAYSSDVV